MTWTIRRNPQGYWYFRDRACGEDVTVYEHQLNACLDHDPRDVFDPDNHVHHLNGVRCDNRPENLAVVDAELHVDQHLNGDGLVESAAADAVAVIPGER